MPILANLRQNGFFRKYFKNENFTLIKQPEKNSQLNIISEKRKREGKYCIYKVGIGLYSNLCKRFPTSKKSKSYVCIYTYLLFFSDDR